MKFIAHNLLNLRLFNFYSNMCLVYKYTKILHTVCQCYDIDKNDKGTVIVYSG